MRALVLTVVHHPDDARIRHRQVAALLAAGWQVSYAAPFSGYAVTRAPEAGLTTLDVPRAHGRHRGRALRAARSLLRERAAGHDVVLVHDPELLLAVRGLPVPVVWDVHEDTAAALRTKPWLPPAVVPVAAAAVRRAERAAERRVHLLLAEDAYRDRFAGPHPVVPNCAHVPATVRRPDDPRVVYVGHLTRARGADDLVAAGRALADTGIRVELVGHADAEATTLLARAHDRGVVDWRGFLPSAQAMGRVAGATAGLSLLHDEPNYRHSRPTKVLEYLAHGVPALTTPLPLAARTVEDSGGGVVVPFGGSAEVGAATADAVRRLVGDPDRRRAMGAAGHAWARAHVDWALHAPGFVRAMTAYAGRSAPDVAQEA
ncbi:glycosyltransferase [Nocardioides guangzhouensis]|uniref:Glycosyltransferase n=1 Tax=Nocardioides guangzhouensis TaxID=2497878 RepID=A0A4Q4ZJT1_9ACTN|nr:glycosyltransferase [Nocardioides guangzhouensis]RYP87776.1 glycosyltransferase [Nocardioides guangzhouensis]